MTTPGPGTGTLQRVDHANGVVTLQSPRLAALGVVHAFTTRVGGVSRSPFDTLNLGHLTKDVGDENANVAENFRRLRAALGVERKPRIAARQVHGHTVWAVPPGKPTAALGPEADALVTDDPLHLLTIRTADCLPVLFTTPDGQRVAAAHAGWRGLVAGVLPATVDALCERPGVEAGSLTVAVGPGIGAEAYAIGPEVATAFEQAGLADAVRQGPGGSPHVDLRAAAWSQLQRAGLDPARVDLADACTHRDVDLYFSYRRDGARTGRMAAVIGAKDDAAREEPV